MLDIFLASCTAFIIALLIILIPTLVFMMNTISGVRRECREFTSSLTELVKRYPSQIKKQINEETSRAGIASDAPAAKKNVSTVPEIDPTRFSAILKNPPRAPGGFGVVVKNDKDKGQQDEARDS